ncbi:MAG: tetratricopeptide repeat protein [Verrucomicrobia bacterium]|nr:tetratricopeptide repeat protein [Verrucomicrobiota bacterium]
MRRVSAVPAVLAALTCTGPLDAHPEIEAALSRLNAQITVTPADASLYVQRGELYARHEAWVMAEANYLRAAELAPDFPRLNRARAALDFANGRMAAARARLTRVLAADPKDAEALVLRARAHAALGTAAAAIADFNAALALIASPSPELYLERAGLYSSPGDALRSLDEGLSRLGPVVTLELRALALEESLGRTDAALARLDRIAGQSERKESWLKRRGDLLARSGRPAEARAAYAAALAAIAALPDWLRETPDTVRLAAELTRLTSSDS